MNITEILHKLDIDRIGNADRLSTQGVVRDFTIDGRECTIIYSCCSVGEIDEVIRQEKTSADEFHYALEWKVYGHDGPANLKERLLTAGFETEQIEKFMVLPVTLESLAAFDTRGHDVRRIDTTTGLVDLAASAAESGQWEPAEEIRRLGPIMESAPETMSVFVAYVDDRPVAGARIHYRKNGSFAGFYGGRTNPGHRNQGLYTALVAARLREALERNVPYVFVDALPTSEPILKKRGFQIVTDTQPFVYKSLLGSTR